MSRMIPQYDTKLMTEIWSTAADFVDDYTHIGIPTTITNQSATTLFYLLYARYGNNPIANYDEEQFKYKIFSVVFQYGPTWEKKLALQETLRGLQLSDLIDDGQISELFEHEGENGLTESTSSTSERDTEQTVTGTEDATTTVDGDTTSTGTSTVAHTGTSTVAKTGTQGVTHTGTSTVASTGTSALAHTGTVGVVHDNDIENSGNDTTVNNHAFNPGTAPAVNAYDPLTYINEQNAQKITKGTKSEQDESSTTTYANTDTTTNNLQNQTTNNLTDTTTNNLSDQTTNNLTDLTTNNLAGTNDSETVLDRDTSSHTTGSDDVTTSGSKTVSGSDSASDTRTRTMKVGKLEAYDRLLKLLDSDVTGEFISKFKLCFKQFVFPERTWIYVTEDGQEED